MSNMSSIATFLQEIKDVELPDEDGAMFDLGLQSPLPHAELEEWRRMIGLDKASEVVDLYQFCNGGSFFGINIAALQEAILFPDDQLLLIHDWGNGDFDCVEILENGLSGRMCFANHDVKIRVPVADSLLEWFNLVFDEIRQLGTLLHPADYRHRNEQGLYAHVLEELRGVECELNQER